MLAGMLVTVGGDLHSIYSAFLKFGQARGDALGSKCLGWLCLGNAGDWCNKTR